MERVVLVTGANGHLGRNIVVQLAGGGARVRALVLPGEEAPILEAAGVEVVRGDVRDIDSLRPLFAGLAGCRVDVIHAAGVVDITSKVSDRAWAVNVEGTRNMVWLALEHRVHRFVYVSSVHAIAEAESRRLMHETKAFAPEAVHGGYAKTKAEATRLVLQAAEKQGLPAVVLHPSGILGPMDSGTNNVVAAVKAYLDGKMPACPRGGYDLVDVRDVAAACVAALDKGRVGETYILSGRHYEFTDLFAMLGSITGKKRRCPVVPLWMAKLAAPAIEWRAKRRHRMPLVTRYSMRTLGSNDNFSHEKASRELGFWPRDIYETLKDTVQWLQREEPAAKPRRRWRRRARAAG